MAGVLLAIAGVILLLVWTGSNHPDNTAYTTIAITLALVFGTISTVILWLASMGAWCMVGEPFANRCREKRGLPGPRQTRPTHWPITSGTVIGAAAGLLGAVILTRLTTGAGMDPGEAAALAGITMGAVTGAGIGPGITVWTVRDARWK